MENHKLFETMPPTRLFFRCAIPSMISMAVTSLYTIADGIFVGRFIGADALAAINLVFPLIMISFALGDMVAVGSSVQIAIRLGEKKPQEASAIFTRCSVLIVMISIVTGAAALVFGRQLVLLMGADPVVTGLAVSYMRVYALFAPLIMVFFAVDNYLRICGKVKYSMGMNITIALLNIALDALFIVVFGWGIASAALASCISLAVGTFICYYPFLRGKLVLRFTRRRVPVRLLGNILANGSSEFFSNISSSVMMVILNTVLLRLSGALAVAAFSIVMYIDSIMKSILFGMTDSLQPAISYNYGARNPKRVLALEKRLMGAGFLISAVVMSVMLLFGGRLILLFTDPDNEALITMGMRAMQVFSLSYLVAWFGMIASSFFTALNRPAVSLTVAFCQTLIFPVVCLSVLPRFLGLDGVWATSLFSGLLTILLAGTFFVILIRALKHELIPPN